MVNENDLFQSHIPARRDGQVVGYEETPFISLVNGFATVTLKGGKFWGSGGDEIDEDDVPDWVFDEIRKLTPEARKSVGIEVSGEAPKEVKAPQPAPPAKENKDSKADAQNKK